MFFARTVNKQTKIAHAANTSSFIEFLFIRCDFEKMSLRILNKASLSIL